MSLARKYRPIKFKDLIGQETVKTALLNSIKLSRYSKSTVLTGIRGIGKTTIARIYAKALNCIEPLDYDACGKCDNCLRIAKDIHQDIIEIDGASNTSVDNIRNIQENISYKPVISKFKVYIIDEVHMLSQSAFNALLKTIEEPPKYVFFIFITTQIKKIPKTVISRCQVYYLKKIPTQLIVKRLEYILLKEKIEYETKTLNFIANHSQGSLRDSLTLLDQTIAWGEGKVNMKALDKFNLFISPQIYIDLIDKLIKKDAKEIIKIISLMDNEKADYHQIIQELAKYIRDALIVKNIKNFDANVLELDQYNIEKLSQINSLDLELNNLFNMIIKCFNELTGNQLDRFVFENYCLQWCIEKKTSINDDKFPKTWQHLVEIWKEKKPLQARKFEELRPIVYSPEKIEVFVMKGNLIYRSIIDQKNQLKIEKDLQEIIGFKGKFIVRDNENTNNIEDSIIEKEIKKNTKIKKDMIQKLNENGIIKSFDGLDIDLDNIEINISKK